MKHNDWSNRERESLKTISFLYFINGDRIDIDIRFCRKNLHFNYKNTFHYVHTNGEIIIIITFCSYF